MCCDALHTGWGKVDDMVIPIPSPQQMVSITSVLILIMMASKFLHTMARCVLIIHTLAMDWRNIISMLIICSIFYYIMLYGGALLVHYY